MTVTERLLHYVSFDTQSDESSETCPSTAKQKLLGEALVEEMRALGIADARIDADGYVYGSVPGTPGAPAIGLIAHMDTSPDCSGRDIKPRIVEYTGGDIALNDTTLLSPADFPILNRSVGKHLIVTDGTTLLGADDKAGIAEIMTLLEELQKDGAPHGRIAVCFTPDEEVGCGTANFDIPKLGADYAYTLDGGPEGEVVFENFNACAAVVHIIGVNVHPGSAKNVMVNAGQVATEFNALLPNCDTPRYTEGYEGFFHLTAIAGTAERAELRYILRDHDGKKLEMRREMMEHIAKTLNARYGEGTVSVSFREQYRNMAEKIRPDHIHLVENAVKAAEECGVKPLRQPIRGGTDGAQLSWEGLPCPNLGTGGYAFHGPYEHVTVEGMDKCVAIIRRIVEIYAERSK